MALLITTAMTDTFKKEVYMGTHLFKASGGNVFKLGLFKAAAAGAGPSNGTPAGTYNQFQSAYGAGSGAATITNVGTDEATDTSGNAQYTAGGFTMTPNADPALDTTNHIAYIDWTTDPNWGTSATITSRGCFLYNSTAGGNMVAVLDFGADKTCTTGTFTTVLPAPAYNTALLRL